MLISLTYRAMPPIAMPSRRGWRIATCLAAGFCAIAWSTGAAQSIPPAAGTQPAPAVAPAIALRQLPRYAGAAVLFADREAGTHRTLEALQRIPPQYQIAGAGFKAALDHFSQETGLNLSVHWSALAKAGIARDTAVTLALKNVTYHKILTLLLAAAGTPRDPLAYQLQDGVVIVSTQAVFDNHREFVTYDLDNYLTMFFNRNIPPAQQEQEAADLTTIIQQSIAPDHWKPGENKVANYHGTLIVNAPAQVQLQVAQLLADMQTPTKPPKAPPILAQSANRTAAYNALQKPFAAHPIAPTLGAALQQIQAAAALNLIVDWPALAAVGLTPQSPVAPAVKDGPTGAVLQALVQSAGERAGLLDFVLDDEGVVTIATAHALAQQTAIGVYDIRDWIKRQQYRAANPKPTADELITPLMDRIKQTVAPDTWGHSAAIQPFQGLLVINATLRNQRTVLEHLAKLVKPAGG